MVKLNFESIRHIVPKSWIVSSLDGHCTLKGIADAIWKFPEGSWFVVDYKLASWTDKQERLSLLYHSQLNAYAYLAEKSQGKSVIGLVLLYFEPEYEDALHNDQLLHRTRERFMFGFRCNAVPVEMQPLYRVEGLCQKICHILSSPVPPQRKANCSSCKALADWFRKRRY